MPTLEERIQRLEDESAIRRLIARFADCATCNDPDNFSKLWSPDSNNKPTWILSEPFPTNISGVPEITDLFRKLRDGREFFIQGVHTGVFEIAGNQATGRWIMRELSKGPGESYYSNYAVYDDQMVKINGEWYFSKRIYNYVYLDSSPFAGNTFALPDLSTFSFGKPIA